jgi:hypothetical protein
MRGIRAAHVAMCALAVIAASSSLHAESASAPDVYRQSRDDAWWTGPILAAGANTLPPGHVLIEPYLFDITNHGRFDADGNRHSGARRHSYGSLTYLNYGLVENFTVGVIPRFGYNNASTGPDSSGVGLGDFQVQGTIRLVQFREGSRVPTVSIVVSETLPTGKYDHLGARPSDGLGSGAYTTTLALYSQYFLWMPNGRILRTRLNLSYSLSDDVTVKDVSVYGTSEGFRGHAQPGHAFIANSSWEYSMTRNWVLALDVVYENDTSTKLNGFDAPSPAGQTPLRIERRSGSSDAFTVAPAIEYNWNGQIGLIAGAILTPKGRNASANVVPVVALNMVF